MNYTWKWSSLIGWPSQPIRALEAIEEDSEFSVKSTVNMIKLYAKNQMCKNDTKTFFTLILDQRYMEFNSGDDEQGCYIRCDAICAIPGGKCFGGNRANKKCARWGIPDGIFLGMSEIPENSSAFKFVNFI